VEKMIKGFTVDGKNYAFDEYIAMSLRGETLRPFSYLTVLADSLKHEHAFPSPSMVFSCPRKVFIERNYDYYVEPDNAFYAFRGTMLHRTLEAIEWQNALKEQKVEIDTGMFKMKGTCDLFLIDQKQLRDYKTIAKIAFDYSSGGPVPANYLFKESYFNQLNLYVLGLRQAGYEVESAYLEYYGMDSASEIPVIQIPVPIDTEKAILKTNNALSYIMRAIETGTPPDLNACLTDFSWMCTRKKIYCQVKDLCDQLHNEGR
jgi:hypothetical protein